MSSDSSLNSIFGTTVVIQTKKKKIFKITKLINFSVLNITLLIYIHVPRELMDLSVKNSRGVSRWEAGGIGYMAGIF